jgi:hypothetical protein
MTHQTNRKQEIISTCQTLRPDPTGAGCTGRYSAGWNRKFSTFLPGINQPYKPPVSMISEKAGKIKGYFWGFFPFSGFALGGLPLPGTLRMASKSFSVYKASCEKGLRPALRRRLLTVSFGKLSFSAISEIVIPVIPHIIGSLSHFLKNVHYKEHLLNKYLVKSKNLKKNVHKKGYFILTNCSFIWTIYI